MVTSRKRRAAVVAATAFAASFALVGPAVAQQWPTKPVTLIVPFPPGGSVDPLARLIGAKLSESLHQQFVVENKPGAGGSIGTGAAAAAAPDGYTWLFVFDTHAVNPALIPNLSYDGQKDLDPVLLIGTAPNVLATHPSRPYRSLAEVIAAARARPRAVTYATVGAGSLGHLTMVLLSKRAGVDLVHVPYRGGGPAINDAPSRRACSTRPSCSSTRSASRLA